MSCPFFGLSVLQQKRQNGANIRSVLFAVAISLHKLDLLRRHATKSNPFIRLHFYSSHTHYSKDKHYYTLYKSPSPLITWLLFLIGLHCSYTLNDKNVGVVIRYALNRFCRHYGAITKVTCELVNIQQRTLYSDHPFGNVLVLLSFFCFSNVAGCEDSRPEYLGVRSTEYIQ